MAGLQYNFFPTDFFFPPPPTAAADGSSHPPPAVVKLPKAGEKIDEAKAGSAVISKSLKIATSSSPVASTTPIRRSQA